MAPSQYGAPVRGGAGMLVLRHWPERQPLTLYACKDSMLRFHVVDCILWSIN